MQTDDEGHAKRITMQPNSLSGTRLAPSGMCSRVEGREIDEEDHLRYRCHVGHAFSPASLMVDQTIAVEQNIWTALRAVEEKATMLRRFGSRSSEQIAWMKGDYELRARELDAAADMLKELLAGVKS